jgi:glycosyltransferase involved in cell wall biosynthesis
MLIITSTFPRWRDDHEPPFVYELARRLTDRFAVTVLAPHAPGSALQEQMDGVEVRRFRYAPDQFEKLAYAGGIPTRLRRHPWLALLVPVFVLMQLLAAYRLVRQLKPVSVHAHWLITGGLIATLIKRLSKIPFRLLVTAHGGDVYGLRHPLAVRLKRWVLAHADHVTVVSEALAGELRELGVDPDKMTIQGMGTDLSNLFVPHDRPHGRPTLVYAGRLVKKKGVDTLLRAGALAHRTVEDLQIIIAGHGPERHDMETLAEQLDVQAITRFSGPYRLTDLPRIYAGASLAAFPFRTAADGDQDGLGLAIVEAMGCGVPVIGSDLAVLDDLLIDGTTALRAPVDDVEAFAAAIMRTLDDPGASRQRAAAARELVASRYDWHQVASRYASLLNPDREAIATQQR